MYNCHAPSHLEVAQKMLKTSWRFLRVREQPPAGLLSYGTLWWATHHFGVWCRWFKLLQYRTIHARPRTGVYFGPSTRAQGVSRGVQVGLATFFQTIIVVEAQATLTCVSLVQHALAPSFSNWRCGSRINREFAMSERAWQHFPSHMERPYEYQP